MDNVLNTLCTVITGYVSGYNEEHASLTPQKRKREQENVMSPKLLIAMVNAEFKERSKDLSIVYERKPKHSLKLLYPSK